MDSKCWGAILVPSMLRNMFFSQDLISYVIDLIYDCSFEVNVYILNSLKRLGF